MSKTLDEKKSIKKSLDIHVSQVKTMRFDLEQNARLIEEIPALYPHLNRYLHIMIRDSRTYFKILQKIEEIGVPLRQALKLDIAFYEKKNMHMNEVTSTR